MTAELQATDLSRVPAGQPLALSLTVSPLAGAETAKGARDGTAALGGLVAGGAADPPADPHASSQRLTIVVRIPGWAWLGAQPSARLNGEPVPIPKHARSLRLSRTWSPADLLHLELWPTLRLEEPPDSRPQFASLRAVFYGPLLLAALAHEAGVRRLGVSPADPPVRWMAPVPREAREQYVSIRELGPRGEKPPAAGARMWVHAQGRLFVRDVPAPPPSDRPSGGGGTNASAAATWRLQPAGAMGPSGSVFFEAFDRPGLYIAAAGGGAEAELLLQPTPHAFWPRAALTGAAGGSSFESTVQPGSFISTHPAGGSAGGPLPSSRLRLARAAGGGDAFAGASSFAIGNRTETPPPLAFWARPPAGAPEADAGGFLMYALNEVLDERYSVYLELGGRR